MVLSISKLDWQRRDRREHPKRYRTYRLKYRDRYNLEYRQWYANNIESERKRSLTKYYKNMTTNPDKLREYNRTYSKTPRGVLKTYQRNANRRKLPFDITFEQLVRIIKRPCRYCGTFDIDQPRGLDRVDNTKGYIQRNVVPCCARCNRMKFQMTARVFIEHCKKIAKKIG